MLLYKIDKYHKKGEIMKNNKMVTFRIIIILLFIVGLAVTSSSLIVIFNNYQKSKIFTPINAVVVDHDKKDNGLKSIVVEYNLEEKYYRITSKHYSRKPEKIDTEIRIKYNPENPSEIIWIDNNHNNKYFISGLILLVGSIIMFMILRLVDSKKAKLSKIEETGSLELPIQKEMVDEISEIQNALQNETKTETITEEQAEKEEIITLPEQIVEEQVPETEQKQEQQPVIEETKTVEEQKNEEVTKEENITAELVEAAEQEPILPKVAQEKTVIPELPVDEDSPREAITSNILDMTVSMPALTKEELTIELPIIKQD